MEIDPPLNSITTPVAFSNDADALSALLGIYSRMISTGSETGFGNGLITAVCGTSADELLAFTSPYGFYGYQFQYNTLLSNNIILSSVFWDVPFNLIYRANACIEGVNASDAISSAVKNQITGEAKFFRAFFYFYMVNLYGDVPIIYNTDFNSSKTVSRSSKEEVSQLIIQDLTDAETLLSEDYALADGEKIRITKWAAAALLARVYLYQQDYANAEKKSNEVISQASLFSLSTDPEQVFLKNSSEAILQLKLNTNIGPFNLVPEGLDLRANCPTCDPKYILTQSLLDAFEEQDKRKNGVDRHHQLRGDNLLFFRINIKHALQTAFPVRNLQNIIWF